MKHISRREFLRGAAAGAAGAAALGVLGTAAATEAATESAPATKITDTVYSTAAWRVPPEKATEFAAEYEADVCVCGHGYAGVTSCRELSSQGFKVILLERKEEDVYTALGNASGTLGGTYITEKRGYEPAEPVDFYQNWMLCTQNYANQSLIMRFSQKCVENIDWYYGLSTEEELDTMADYYLDSDCVGNHRLKELGGLKFWNPAYSCYGSMSQTVVQGYNRADAIAHGATFLFGHEAQYLEQDDSGAVTAVVATDESGNYVRVKCKAAILATGGFAGNTEMMNDLILDMAGSMVEGESMTGMMDSDGRGIQMAYWAGAKLESWGIPGMNFKHWSPSASVQSTQPQALWIDRDGKRFCNEYYPVIEFRGRPTLFKPRDTYYVVFDDNFDEYSTYFLPQHGGFNPTESNVNALRSSMDSSYAAKDGAAEAGDSAAAALAEGAAPGGSGEGGAPAGGGFPSGGGTTYKCGDTIEELADNLGLTGTVKENFVASVARYNAMCHQGRDDDFGRSSEVLFPVEQGPFYGIAVTPSFGSSMVTLGGLLTDGEQNVLGQDYEPIKGLYASGNTCGRRYGNEYFTPIFGISLGICIVLGRECGRSVADYLRTL